MRLSWLHVSDFHFKSGDPYDRDKVLTALVEAVRRYREDGWRPDLVFATGDVADRGAAAEYQAATGFFDDLLEAAGVEKRRLFVIPGNHDVDRGPGEWLVRTLPTGKAADAYFAPKVKKQHLREKQQAFVAWYDRYFDGIRSCPVDSTCGPVEVAELADARIGVLPVNSALFCQDDNDHGKLWVGRRCLDDGVKALADLGTDLNVALVHHPLDWLHHDEQSNIRTKLRAHAQVILRGHLHETDVEHAAGVMGDALHMAAGAAYQGSEWPNRALYVRVEDDAATVFPIRYVDKPREVWTLDASVFPLAPDHCHRFPIPRRAIVANPPPPAARADAPAPGAPFRCNVPARRRGMPFVGRDELLQAIAGELGETTRQAVLVLRGPSGVGKSELAREFARVSAARYPGGRVVLDAGGEGPEVELARLGTALLDLGAPPPGMEIADQALRALRALAGAPTLLLYDNVRRPEDIEAWLPPDGMPCHVLITSTLESWGPGWPVLDVRPLGDDDVIGLVRAIAGGEAADRFGDRMVKQAGGLPVQIVPMSAMLEKQARRGRLDEADLTLAREAGESFRGVYERLDAPARILLHTAARFNPQQIPRDELELELIEALGWTAAGLRGALDACLDLYLLQEGPGLRMHQLLASFLHGQPPGDEAAGALDRVLAVQARRLVEAAREVQDNPADAARAARLLAFPVEADAWDELHAAADGEVVGRALVDIGRFAAARPWFERAVAEKERGDVHGRIDHASLGTSLHAVGYCLSRTGDHAAARPWFERAVAEKEQGDVQGRVDHASLGTSLHQVGVCLSQTGDDAAARPWYERAVAEAERGDVHGRVDHESLGTSLHQVGVCLSRAGDDAAARPWYERAVAESERGDVHGRVDHQSLGSSLHQVGVCLSQTGDHAAARPWFERAVAEKEHGDVHGRIDHASLGKSLHQVGTCLSRTGDHAAARPWYERAVAEAEQGDVHGRVDHESLGTSLHQVGVCLSQAGGDAAARPWFERAVAEAEQGDVFGRVDHASLGTSLRYLAFCLRRLGEADAAEAVERRAAGQAAAPGPRR